MLVLVFITATTFTLGDRAYRSGIFNETLGPHNQIIQALVTETDELKESFNTSSQWPAGTMLALKRPVFPLPPPVKNPEELTYHRQSRWLIG